jgi:excisionase family DNA binding protein
MATEDWLTTEQAAELSGYHIVHVRKLLLSGKLHGRKWGQAWQVSRESLLAYVQESTQRGEKRGPKSKVS